MKKFPQLVSTGGQEAPHLVHSPGDGRLRDAENLGRFSVAQLLAGNERRSVAQCRLQPSDSAFQPDRIVKVAAVLARSGDANEGGEALGKGSERALLSPKVTAGVEGNAANPGGELCFAAKTTDFLNERATDILGDVVGIRSRAGQMPSEAVNPIVVTFEQRRERIAVARTSCGD